MNKTLEQAIEVYGADMQLNIAIEEFSELTKEICKYKRGADNIPHIAEEIADCYIMLEQLQIIFDFDDASIYHIMDKKIERLKSKMANVTVCQQNQMNLPCNIGDTAYCVNGYENKYIESFTVAEIVIRKEGIYLIDTNGAEWLARVCHFSRESAERELKYPRVDLPVEVGDTVFLPYITDFETVEQYKVIEVGQDKDGQFFRIDDEESNKVYVDEIGKTVFLTPKEATEKVLQKMDGVNNG